MLELHTHAVSVCLYRCQMYLAGAALHISGVWQSVILVGVQTELTLPSCSEQNHMVYWFDKDWQTFLAADLGYFCKTKGACLFLI